MATGLAWHKAMLPNLRQCGASGINTALTSTPGFVNAVTPAGNVSAPQAYLTIMFFDERFNFISAADGGVSQAQVAATWSTSTSPLALGTVKAPKNGYVYVYISNRSDQHVYFDDFKVSLQAGNIIEENHYYSFGLKIAAISSKKLGHVNEGVLKNDYLYNDKELFDDGDLNWYNYGFRNYDPQIGRFPQLDPLTDYYAVLTPYQYAGNDPIANVDLDGLEPLSSVNGAVSGVTGAARDFTYAYNTASLVLGPAMQAATATSTIFTSINLVASITSLVATGANIVSDIINSKSVTQQVGNELTEMEIQGMLSKISKDLNSTFDLAWKLSFKNGGVKKSDVEEWSFTITMKKTTFTTEYNARNLHTNHLNNKGTPDFTSPAEGEDPIGNVHTHPYSKAEGSYTGIPFSSADINSLRAFKDLAGGLSMVEAGTKRFALVVSDPVKAKIFFSQNSLISIKKSFDAEYNLPKNRKLGFDKRVKKAIKAVIGDGSKSGIKFFESTDKNKLNFKRI